MESNTSDKAICERFAFRDLVPEDIPQVIEIEQICFPPHEVCSPEMMRERANAAPETFLVAVDRATGKLAGFLNGIATNEDVFRDAFFRDASLHQKNGACVMLCGLDVLPPYRRQGLARELVRTYCRREQEKGRKRLVLTCLEDKVNMYRKLGFTDRGISGSTWGDEQWHEMDLTLND